MRPRKLAWPAAVAAVAALHALAAWTTPPRVPLADVPDHLGDRVQVEGRVRDVRPLDGALLLELTDGDVYLPALLRGDGHAPVEPGDHGRVTGTVELYHGTHEVTGRARDLTVLETRDRPLDPSTVALEPRRYLGTPLQVEGRVQGGEGSWRIADGDAALGLEPADPRGLSTGIRVVAEGELGYRTADAAYALEDAAWHRR